MKYLIILSLILFTSCTHPPHSFSEYDNLMHLQKGDDIENLTGKTPVADSSGEDLSNSKTFNIRHQGYPSKNDFRRQDYEINEINYEILTFNIHTSNLDQVTGSTERVMNPSTNKREWETNYKHKTIPVKSDYYLIYADGKLIYWGFLYELLNSDLDEIADIKTKLY